MIGKQEEQRGERVKSLGAVQLGMEGEGTGGKVLKVVIVESYKFL